jgi:hypothetical protein
MVWPVVVDAWQHDCCGAPFAVGDHVDWKLILREESTTVPADELAPIEARVDRVIEGPGGSATIIVTDDGLCAVWAGPRPSGEVLVTGAFAEDHHGGVPDDLPSTRGTVRRIRLLARRYRRSGEGNPCVLSREVETTDVTGVSGMLPGGPPAENASLVTGILVDLDVGP